MKFTVLYPRPQLCATLLILLVFSLPALSQGRTTLQMNSGWGYYKGDLPRGEAVTLNDSDWEAVSLPHVLQTEQKHCGGNRIYQGCGWYRRYFTLGDELRGQRLTLNFEGVMKRCEVYLNGRLAGSHEGGYLGFNIDITPYVRWGGNNVLAVKVTSIDEPLIPPGKPQGKMDFYYYSGIYRDVTLTATGPLYISDPLDAGVTAGGGLFITYPAVNQERAETCIKTHLVNSGTTPREVIVQNSLVSSKGRCALTLESRQTIAAGKDAEVVQKGMVERPQLWSIDTPNLYTLVCEVKDAATGKRIDHMEQKVGIRTLAFTRTGGFYLNGKQVFLNGTNRHQAFPYVGDAASNSMQERDVRAIKRAGFNAIRAAHYPHDPAFLAACDKYGLVVIECITGWQYYSSDSLFNARLDEVDRGMVRRDRNHPCVVCWETALNESSYPTAVAERLYRIVHQEYPGDQTFTSGDYLGSEEKKDFFDVLYKQVSRYPKDGNVMSNYLEDMLSIKPLFTREWGDGAGWKPRVSLTENEEEQAKQCIGRIDALMGKGYFDWCMLDANPNLGGHFLWCYADFARGCEDETEYCGVVDMNRAPKFSYYMTQSMRRPVKDNWGLFPGPMVHITSYNSDSACFTDSREIWVFSNCDSVRLYRNGTLIGSKSRREEGKKYAPLLSKGASPCYVFKVNGYEAGELRAEGLIAGKVAARDRVCTAGAAAAIKVEAALDGVAPVADGSDMIPIYFRIVDEKGNWVTTSAQKIHITVTGEGVLMGAGIEAAGIEHQQVEGGIGFAFVRTTTRHGKITICASADGLKSGTATVKSVPFKEKSLPNGLHAPFTGHEVYVSPEKQWKQEVLLYPQARIVQVEAGSEQAAYPKENMIDGDDRTWWIASEGTFPQTVTLTLEKPMWVEAVRIAFQKDSSYYRHKVESSADGVNWEPLYEGECTGFDFEPRRVERKVKQLRITITGTSAGMAGIGEVTLFTK